MATPPTYASAEAAAAAFDAVPSAAQLVRLARITQTASRSVDAMLNRGAFYPRTMVRSWRWPRRDQRLWLPDDLISATALEFDGQTVTGYTLEPRFDGPPYTWVDLDDATSAGGDIVELTGVWGYQDDTRPVTVLASSPNASTASITVVDGQAIGVGDLLQVDTERMVVTARALADTTCNATDALDASLNDDTIGVNSGALVAAGETIAIDSERMRVLAVVGNTLTVQRAVDGTVLATHANPSDIYAFRALTVERGAVGSTAAAHTAPAAVSRWYPPALIAELALAEAQTLFGQETSGWTMTVGEGEAQRESSGRSLRSIRIDARQQFRRWNYGAV